MEPTPVFKIEWVRGSQRGEYFVRSLTLRSALEYESLDGKEIVSAERIMIRDHQATISDT